MRIMVIQIAGASGLGDTCTIYRTGFGCGLRVGSRGCRGELCSFTRWREAARGCLLVSELGVHQQLVSGPPSSLALTPTRLLLSALPDTSLKTQRYSPKTSLPFSTGRASLRELHPARKRARAPIIRRGRATYKPRCRNASHTPPAGLEGFRE